MTATSAAWQAALAAEYEAVFGYGVLGPHLTGRDQALAIACSNAHEQLRDGTEAGLQAAGVQPDGPAADYPQLYPVTTPALARALAVRLEDSCAEAWRFLYVQAGVPLVERRAAQQNLTASAVRAAKWRVRIDPANATKAFPGVSSS